jgi:hypothetical protein
MKAIRHTLVRTMTAAVAFSALTLFSMEASAAVQYRIGFDTASNSYVVYMTPDSTPSPDMLLSAQVTLVVPHSSNNAFSVDNITSHINGVNWMDHSRVDAPSENAQADYVSLGYYFSGSGVPNFGWVAGQEKKILSFTSNQGCVAGVKLIDNQDAFSQLPNSAGTNPGNDFLNLGWQMSNAYTGNYGGAVTCDAPTPACDASQDQATLDTIAALEQRLQTVTNPNTKKMLLGQIQRLRDSLVCQ